MKKSLFAVYLGGKAPRARLEMHDIAFVVGTKIKDTFPALKKMWFGDPSDVHVDSWVDLTFVDGHEFIFSDKPLARKSRPKLFFVNAGYYEKDLFGEQHRFLFLVDTSLANAKSRVRKALEEKHMIHIDNLFEIDAIEEIDIPEAYELQPVKDCPELVFNQVYWPIREPSQP